MGLSREQGLVLLQEHIKNPNMIKHCLVSEAVLGALAEHLGEDREKRPMGGFLPDLDVEITNADLRRVYQNLNMAPQLKEMYRNSLSLSKGRM